MQLKLIIQCVAFFLSIVVIPLLAVFQQISWLTNWIGFPLQLISIICKISRITNQTNWLKKLLKTQIAFLVPYTLLVLLCYFYYETTTSFQPPAIDISFGILRLIFQFINYSLISLPETLSKQERIVYLITLLVWVFQNGIITVLIIKIADGDADSLTEEFKDLNILLCTTIIASGILIIDIIERASEVKEKEIKKQAIQIQLIAGQ